MPDRRHDTRRHETRQDGMDHPRYAVPLDMAQITQIRDCVHWVDQVLTKTIEEHLDNQNLESYMQSLIARIDSGDLPPIVDDA